ncbi:MAG: hydrogenase nickel incorporation protein HypA [Candidatus Bathyarchaeia archaeon]
MHEWALAEAIIASASQVAEEEGLKQITEVKIRVGELQQVELDILEFALSQLKTTKFADAKFKIESVKARLKCRACGLEWSFSRSTLDEKAAESIHFIPEVAHAYIKCPKCGSPDFEILEGRGVWLESIRGIK